jgi:hypothetical protein
MTPHHRALPRWLTWLAWGSLAVLVLALTTPFVLMGSDIWLHLSIGRYTVAHGWPPLGEPFSYTVPGQRFIAQEWLSGVIFYLAYSHGGIVGLIALRTLIMSLTYALVLQTAHRLGVRLSVLVPLGGLMIVIVTNRVIDRPHARQADCRCHAVSLAHGQPVAPGSWVPGVYAASRRGDHANQEAAGPAPHARAANREPADCAPSWAHRARQQQREALSHRPRHHPSSEGGRPRSGHGSLLCAA